MLKSPVAYTIFTCIFYCVCSFYTLKKKENYQRYFLERRYYAGFKRCCQGYQNIFHINFRRLEKKILRLLYKCLITGADFSPCTHSCHSDVTRATTKSRMRIQYLKKYLLQRKWYVMTHLHLNTF